MYDTRTVLILTGAREWDRAHKTFTPPANPGDKPYKQSDYHMGKFFCWRTERLAEGTELLSMMELLGRLGDETQSFIVPGQPMPWLVPGELIHRRKVFIDAPIAAQLFKLDVDGWETGIKWWESAESLRLAVHTGMALRGLDYLTTQQMVIVLSQSAWPGHDLRCRVYMWLQKPIKLDDLRRWAKVVNNRIGDAVGLDPSVYGQVHIDYTARRECQGFDDPVPPSFRYTCHDPDELALSTELAHEGIIRELNDAPKTITSSELPELAGSGDGWDMLKLSGTKGVINEYGYRSAAKIVKAEGKAAVEANLDTLAKTMHQTAWAVIADNSNGERGDEDDAHTYSIAKYKQYLYSATEATIGDDLDEHLRTLNNAINEGATALFGTAAIDAAARLYRGWVGHYQDFRRNLIKARLVRAKDYDGAVESRVRALDRKRRVSAREVDEALDALDGTPSLVGAVLDEDGHLMELPFYNKIAETYDWVGDGDNTIFIDRLDKDSASRGGYRVTDQARVVGEFSLRGMEILNSVAPTVSLPPGCKGNVASLVDRRMKETANDEGHIPSRQWGFRALSNRFKRTPEALWVNLGIEDGQYNCMRCTVDGVKRMTWLESLKYPDAPIWRGGTVPVMAGANDPNALNGWSTAPGGLSTMKEGNWAKELFSLVKLTSSDDEIHVLAWLIAVILGWDTRFILQFRGEQGVGKSTTADILCALLDPMSADGETLRYHQNRRMSIDILSDDKKIFLHLGARDSAVIDNVESLTGKNQDKLCMIATGLGVSREIKYTHITQELVVRCAIILTGIKESDTRPDFGDRLFHATIRGGDYIDVHARFAQIRGRVFDGLIRLAMLVQQQLDSTGAHDRKALVDAIGQVYLGVKGRDILSHNRAAAAFSRIENSRFASTFMAWLQYDEKHWGPLGTFEGRELNGSELYAAYKKWYNASLGDEFIVEGTDSAQYFRVEIGHKMQDKQQPLPASSNHFSRQLNKWTPDIMVVRGGITLDKRILRGVVLLVVTTVEECLV